VISRYQETGDKARVAVLKPLDIVTTAGSAGNIIAALQTYRNTKCGEDGRLFVRGGEANETQTFVDGIRWPYNATIGKMCLHEVVFHLFVQRFSTGGYSAEYGEALSVFYFKYRR
jgi:outer membrane cobalamin receptor